MWYFIIGIIVLYVAYRLCVSIVFPKMSERSLQKFKYSIFLLIFECSFQVNVNLSFGDFTGRCYTSQFLLNYFSFLFLCFAVKMFSAINFRGLSLRVSQLTQSPIKKNSQCNCITSQMNVYIWRIYIYFTGIKDSLSLQD